MAFQKTEIRNYLNESHRKVWTNNNRSRQGCLPKTMIDDPVQAVRDGFTRAIKSGCLVVKRKKKN